MVVLAVAILNESGKILLSRQFVDMTRIRVEGLLAAFPKLLGSNKEHTYVETDNVRYVYHPLESMNLLCITNKGSNIIEDLATLQMLSKVVPETCGELTEQAVDEFCFELIFAFDEVITCGGYKVGLTMSDLRANLKMDSHEEALQKMIIESKVQDATENMRLQATLIRQQKRQEQRDGISMGGKYSGMGSSSLGADPSSSGSMSTAAFGGSSYASSSMSGGGDDSLGVTQSYREPERQRAAAARAPAPAPVKGISLGGPSKNNSFLKAMAVEDNVQSNFYQKSEAAKAGAAATVAAEAAAPRRPVGDLEISCVETVRVLATRDSDVEKVEVRGAMMLTANSERATLATIKFERRDLAGLAVQPNPILDRKALDSSIIRPRAPTKPFPLGVPAGIVKWRFNSSDKSHMPISINVWPEASSKTTTVSLEYNLENLDMVLHDVTIIIPLGSAAAPEILQCDGLTRHNAKTESLEWRHELIDENSDNGQLEFVVAGSDEEAFFPCTVQFSSNYNFADFKFVGALDANKESLTVRSENSMSLAEFTVS